MAQPQVVFGAGHVHVTQVKDALGNKLTPPQVIAAPAVQNIAADFGKADTKMLYGQKEFAIHAAQGKKSTEVSFECGELHAKMLNALYFGQSLSNGSRKIYRDVAGNVVPDSATVPIKVLNVKTFSLGKQKAHTGLKFKNTDGTWAANTEATAGGTPLTAGNYHQSGAVYTFYKDDVGKQVKITRTVLAGSGTPVSVDTVVKIPASLTVNLNAFTRHLGFVKGNAKDYTQTADATLTNKGWKTQEAPAANQFFVADNGVYVFNSAQTYPANVWIKHRADGLAVYSYFSALPTAAYATIINPPSTASFVSDLGVTKTSDNSALSKVDPPTIASQYSASSDGMYTFHSSDADTVLRIDYMPDFFTIQVVAPNEGVYQDDKGVRDTEGLPLTRVALVYPLALLPGQYAASDSGAYYFDNSAAADTFYIDYEYESTDGVTLTMANNDMGSTPIVSLDISGIAEGQEWLIKYPKAIPKAFGFATKLDDFGTYKVTYDVVADRVSGVVGMVYMAG